MCEVREYGGEVAGCEGAEGGETCADNGGAHFDFGPV